MASLMEGLMEILEKENAQYEEMVVLSEEKTPVIVTGDIGKLQEILEQEQPIIEKIQQLEKKREEIINDIAIVLNKDVLTLSLKNIIKMLDGQQKEQNQLAEIHDKLNATLKTMASLNENNRMLLEHSLEMMDFEISLFHGMKKAPETANYGKDAYSKGDVLINSNGFDAKQ